MSPLPASASDAEGSTAGFSQWESVLCSLGKVLSGLGSLSNSIRETLQSRLRRLISVPAPLPAGAAAIRKAAQDERIGSEGEATGRLFGRLR